MKTIRTLGFWLSCAFAVACTSVPVHYHTLDPGRASGDAAHSDTASTVMVQSVRVPAQVDRFELVVRGTDGGGLALAENERWIAPLSDELKQALQLALTRTLAPAGGGAAPFKVRLEVERFESVPGHYALIEASWHVSESAGAGERRLTCRTVALESVGAGYAALVRGHQRAVAVLAADIASAVHAGAWSCRGS